jgi:hypothetical protein
MPWTCDVRGGKWRVVSPDGGAIMVNKNGKPIDGGGHESKEACEAQVRALYANTDEGDG